MKKLRSIKSVERIHTRELQKLKIKKKKVDIRLKKVMIRRKFKNAAVKIQAIWKGYSAFKKFRTWKRRYLSLIRFLQLKFRRREKKKKKGISIQISLNFI